VTASDRMSPYTYLDWRRRVRLAAEVLWLYIPARRSVRRNDLRAMVSLARRVGADMPPREARPDDHDLALLLGRATVRTIALLPSDRRCLVQSLVTLRLMARHGLEGRLVIGVQPGETFAAHAWVEHVDRPVTPEGTFHRLMEA
jgi:hypothetical protein